jgi:hypothetical protein
VEISRFTQLCEFINQGEVITTDGYLRHCQISKQVAYVKRDFLFSGGIWRGDEQRSIPMTVFDGSRPRTIVIGHSDISTRVQHQLLLAAFGVKKIFGINLRPISKLSVSLPLGLTNDCDDSPLHRMLGDLNNLVEADKSSDFCTSFSPTYFVSFNINTNFRTRSEVLQVLKTLNPPNRVIFSEIGYDRNYLIPYLRNLRKIPFVICPEGNGVDTHRLWETLYMGGVPVIKRNVFLNEILEDLPVVVLNDWIELNDVENMHSEWEKINEKKWNFSKLRLSHWKSLISQ